jgi:hypothetical protein
MQELKIRRPQTRNVESLHIEDNCYLMAIVDSQKNSIL